jgi:hypothetical protein
LARWYFRAALVVFSLTLAAVLITRLSNRHYGDVENGAELYYNSYLTCFACHGSRTLAPPLEVGNSRVRENAAALNERLAQYLAESIIDPDKYIVPLYSAGMMPHYNLFSDCLGACPGVIRAKELRDIVVFLMTLK